MRIHVSWAAREDFDQMEARTGGGGAGGCVILGMVLGLALAGVLWAFWPGKATSGPATVAAQVFQEERAAALTGEAYGFFPERPDWADLSFTFRMPAPTKHQEII